MDAHDVQALPAKIGSLLDDLSAISSDAAAGAEELVASVVTLYGAGLERIVDLLAERPDGPELVRLLAGDSLVENLLMLHDLHPDDVATRVQQALDKVRPYLGSHAGGITFTGVDADGVARLQLIGSCDGCAGSAATVHNAVERAVLEAAPELTGVEVEGVVEPKPLLQISLRCPDGLVEAATA
jgi:Fe-S cluster biogenesis protein NfuA